MKASRVSLDTLRPSTSFHIFRFSFAFQSTPYLHTSSSRALTPHIVAKSLIPLLPFLSHVLLDLSRFRKLSYLSHSERQPLLAGGSSKHPTYTRNDTFATLGDSPIAPTNGNGNHVGAAWLPHNSHATTPGRLQELGWLEYHLPDGSFYYLHPTRKIVTDMNLRLEKVLADVSSWIEMEMGSGGFGSTSRFADGPMAYGNGNTGNANGNAGNGKAVDTPGVEVWLRDAGGKRKRRFEPVKCYVDHHARTVVVDRGHHHHGRGKHHKEDDRESLIRCSLYCAQVSFVVIRTRHGVQVLVVH
jgi:hypothetical protein